MSMAGEIILLGEDNEDDAVLFNRTIKKSAWEATVLVLLDALDIQAYLGGSGKYQDRLTYQLPALIFLDGQLRHQPSMWLLSWIVRHPQLKNIPVLLLSGSLDPKVCVEAKQNGALDCLDKPFSTEHVKSLEAIMCIA
jgi:CheY-like chemotaxis protein